MNFNIKEIQGITFLTVNTAKATAEVKEEFEDHLFKIIEKDEKRRVALDLSHVNFVDSSFLGSLVKGLKKITLNMGDIKVMGLQQPVRAMFELTRLFKVFEVFENQDDLIANF